MKKRRIIIDLQTEDDISVHHLVEYMLKLVHGSAIAKGITAIEVRELKR